MKAPLLCATLFGLVSGSIVAGCSGGGSSGGGFAPPSGAGGSLGPVTSDLPAADLNPSGYDFESVVANTTAGAGAVAALAAAPVGTASLVAYTPLNQADLLDNGAATFEESFAASPSSIARLGSDTDMFLATSDRSANGAGDVYRRVNNNGANAWSVALDSDRSEAHVAAVGSSIVALIGGPDQVGEIYEWDDQAQSFSSIATLDSTTPTTAVEYAGVVYVGGTLADAAGGPAQLFRLSSGALEEIQLPVPAVQAGLNNRQEVTAMLVVSNATQGEVLFLAVGLFDLISGAPLGGSILATNGTDFEQVLDFGQDTPSSLAFHDSAVYAGTHAGRLLHRETNGFWLDEPGLPVTTGVTALLSLTPDTLLIGAGSDQGPLVLIRTERPIPASGTPGTPGTPPPSALNYATNVAPVMETCGTCHKARGRVGGNMVLTNPVDMNADYQTVSAYVDLGTPTDSDLLISPQGNNGHPAIIGGPGDASYDALLLWIQQGALP